MICICVQISDEPATSDLKNERQWQKVIRPLTQFCTYDIWTRGHFDAHTQNADPHTLSCLLPVHWFIPLTTLLRSTSFSIIVYLCENVVILMAINRSFFGVMYEYSTNGPFENFPWYLSCIVMINDHAIKGRITHFFDLTHLLLRLFRFPNLTCYIRGVMGMAIYPSWWNHWCVVHSPTYLRCVPDTIFFGNRFLCKVVFLL